MGKRSSIRCHLSPRLFEHLESRLLLDGMFDSWVDDITNTTTDVPVVDTPVDTSSTENNSTDNSVPVDTTNYTDYASAPVLYPPDRPAALTATPISHSSIFLTWQQYNDDADGFYIVRHGPDGKQVVAQLSGEARSYLDQNLAAGTNYRYFVTAFNSDGEADSDGVTAGTLGDHLTVVAQPTTVTAGQPFNIAVDLRTADNRLDSSAHSTLSVALASAPNGATLAALTVQPEAGIATFSGLSLTTAGAYRLAITDGISTTFSRVFSVTADPASAHLVLLQQPQPGRIGKNLNLRFAVDDAFGNLVGSMKSNVTLTLVSGPADGALKGTLTATVKNGNATFATAALTATGTYTLAVTDAALSSRTLQFNQEVAPAASTIAMPRIAAAGYVYGKTIILTTTLKSAANIAFSGEATLIGSDGSLLATATVSPNGAVLFSFTLAPGTYQAALHYSGDANHMGAVSRGFSLKVIPASTSTSLQVSAQSLALGESLELTAAVTAAAIPPAGSLTFHDGKTVLGNVMLDGSGSAALTLSNMAPGTHHVTAVYAGGAFFRAGRSPARRVVVTRAPTAIAMSMSAAETRSAMPASLTLQVTALTMASLVPAGKIVIQENHRTVATLTLSGGAAVWTPASFKSGSHVLVARYLGDASDLASGPLTLNVTI